MMYREADLQEAVETLEMIDNAGRWDFLVGQAVQSGGTYKLPVPDDTWDDRQFHLTLHGIAITGHTKNEVIDRWRNCAKGQCEILEELMIAGETVMGHNGIVSDNQMRRACQLIRDNLRPADCVDQGGQVIWTAATETLRVMNSEAA